MTTTRLAVEASFDDVAAWGLAEGGRCLVLDAGDGWTVADVDVEDDDEVACAGRLAAQIGRAAFVVGGDEGDDVIRVEPTGGATILPSWVDDPDDPEEVGAFETAWKGVPDVLLGDDARLAPPRARQVLLLTTPDELDLRAALTGLAAPLTTLDLDGWSVMTADDDLRAVGAGLSVARRSWAVVLSSDGTLAGLTVLRRGRVVAEHVWNRRTQRVGEDADDDDWSGLLPDPVDADDLVALVRTSGAADHVTLVRAALRAERSTLGGAGVLGAGGPVDRLVHHLGVGEAGPHLLGVLRGDRLEADPRARRLVPAESFWQFLRDAASGAFLDPEEVPWFSIACAALLPVFVVVLVVRTSQLVGGTLDGWGVAQLLGAVVNLPMCWVYLRRVLRWRSLRRPG